MKYLLLLIAMVLPQLALANDQVDDLWNRLKDDFESKPQFHNQHINDFRDGAKSNARPLIAQQLELLPEAKFLSKKPFALAMAGRARLLKAGKIKDLPLLTVVDFSLHSSERRLFVFDLVNAEVLINTYTSHAYSTDHNGDGIAEDFSNVNGSLKTSVGFMSTDVVYNGIYGRSLRMKGHDPKLNSNVFSRAVVVHGFSNMGPEQAARKKMATSEGCLMISNTESGRFWGMDDKPMLDLVIDVLKSGSLVFNYTDQKIIFDSSWINVGDVPGDL